MLIEKGADVNTFNNKNDTSALILAAGHGNVSLYIFKYRISYEMVIRRTVSIW